MSNERIKQRIEYLVTHGGLYPEDRPRWWAWALTVVGLQLITICIGIEVLMR